MFAFQFLLFAALSTPEQLADRLRQQGANGVQVRRVQLDADAPLEAVIQYELPGSGVHAVVFDSREDEWREAGRFNSWANYTKADFERFLEFRETVEPGIQDVVVRTRSEGTEEARTTLDIHRMRNGAMVNVLTQTELLTAMEHPSGDVSTTTTEFSYTLGRVTVRSVTNPGKRRSCRMYMWNPAHYRFEEDPHARATSCP